MYSTCTRRDPARRSVSVPPRPGRRSLIWFLPVLVTAAGLFGLVGQAPVLASTLPAQPAVVFSGGAAPDQLPASGGTIAITGKVGNALSCQLQLLSRQAFSVVFSHNPRNCSSGDFSARVTIGPNNTTVQRTVAFALVASNHSSASTGRFYVLMAGAKPAAVLSVGAAPDNLPAGGGTVAIGGKVGHAVECRLQLLSKQSFPVVYSHNARTCSNGDYSAHITIGPNTTTVQRTIAFSLVASGKVTVSSGKFYVLLAAAHAPVTTTTVPPTTTTLPPTTKPSPTTTTTVPPVTTTTAPRSGLPGTTTVPTASSEEPVAMQSSNWSGYAAVGGPYSVIKGTFTVPGLSAGTSPYDQVSEWVGIDGANGSDAYLIQAGVDEYANPDGSGFEVQPWWEILPAAETNITTVSVSAGDTVSVTIWQVSGTDWEINLTDDTTGKSFTSPGEQYNGPAPPPNGSWRRRRAAASGARRPSWRRTARVWRSATLA